MPKPEDDRKAEESLTGNPSSSSKDTSREKPRKTLTNNIWDFQTSDDAKRWMKKYRTEIAASTASVFSTFIAFPLDFAKSRMQSYDTKFLFTLKDAYRAEGLRGFWRGVGPPLVSVTVVRTISFSIYQRTKYTFDRWIQNVTGESPLSIANARDRYPTLSTISCFGLSGATSGALITFIACPFELTKLHAQLAGKMAREHNPADKPSSVADLKTGAWRTARQLIAERGWRGLYCGYQLHLVRDTLGTAIYFMTYESAKQMLANGRGNSPTHPAAVAAAGGLCGIVSWACIYPIDVTKTLYQKALLASKGHHTVRPDISFWQAGSYRGLGVSVLRSCIINMLFFSNFEMIKKHINQLDV